MARTEQRREEEKEDVLLMIDSRDARECLDAISKCLGGLELGAHSYDGVELLVCAYDRKSSRMVELKRAERLWPVEAHSSEWYELPFPKSFRMSLNESIARFKPY